MLFRPIVAPPPIRGLRRRIRSRPLICHRGPTMAARVPRKPPKILWNVLGKSQKSLGEVPRILPKQIPSRNNCPKVSWRIPGIFRKFLGKFWEASRKVSGKVFIQFQKNPKNLLEVSGKFPKSFLISSWKVSGNFLGRPWRSSEKTSKLTAGQKQPVYNRICD